LLPAGEKVKIKAKHVENMVEYKPIRHRVDSPMQQELGRGTSRICTGNPPEEQRQQPCIKMEKMISLTR
jgi:hypothetical protein